MPVYALFGILGINFLCFYIIFFPPVSPVYLQNTYINEEFCTLYVKCFQCVKKFFQCCYDHYVTTISKLKKMKTDWHESIFYPYP